MSNEQRVNDELERQRDRYRSMMRNHGYALVTVEDDDNDLPFHYTVGLTNGGLPELLLVGKFERPVAEHILNSVAVILIGRGATDQLGQYSQIKLTDLLTDADDRPIPLRLQLIDQAEAERMYLIQAEPILQDHLVGVVQIMTPDNWGRYPDDPGYNFNDYPQVLAAPKAYSQ